MMASTGVFPCYENQFSVGTKGETSTDTDMKPIAEMESYSIKFDGKPQEWTPYETDGWTERMMTGKGFTLSVSGKRCVGDAGNDYIAGLAWLNGRSCNTKMTWNFPSGGKLEFNAVVNVTSVDGGKSEDVAPLEFDVLSNGKPTYTAPAASGA
jgi:hypothetical protein